MPIECWSECTLKFIWIFFFLWSPPPPPLSLSLLGIRLKWETHKTSNFHLLLCSAPPSKASSCYSSPRIKYFFQRPPSPSLATTVWNSLRTNKIAISNAHVFSLPFTLYYNDYNTQLFAIFSFSSTPPNFDIRFGTIYGTLSTQQNSTDWFLVYIYLCRCYSQRSRRSKKPPKKKQSAICINYEEFIPFVRSIETTQ